nr:uncharacterized protein LOC100176526 [Ciona intestinalis]|eukprot:XP_002127039.1 uncharacterized protein LOC100176526 [Ciona intestinalis]
MKIVIFLVAYLIASSKGLKCMRPSDARLVTSSAEIPTSWYNIHWHSGPYMALDDDSEEHEDASHDRGVKFTRTGAKIWWLKVPLQNSHYIINQNQTKLFCAHNRGGLQVNWYDNTEANRGEDWCKWDIESNPSDATLFRMKNHVFSDSVPEVGHLYLDITGLHFDYDENSHNDVRNRVDDARKWWRWVDQPASTTFAELSDACTLGESGLPDFLETSSDDVITVRGARRRSSGANRFISKNKFATCGHGWFLFKKKCYRLFRYIVTRRGRAVGICSYFNGSLVVPKTRKEHSYIRRLLQHYDTRGRYWLGMQASRRGNRFYDIDGSDLTFRKWERKRTTFDTDRCSYYHQGRWHKTNCNAQYKVFCKKPADVRHVMNCGRIQIRSVDQIMQREYESEETKGRVVNGLEAAEGQFPWQASIRFRVPQLDTEGNQIIHNCGGTLIDECWVLTAAHCFIDRDASIFTVRLGDLNNRVSDDTEQDFAIERLIIHEEFSLYPSARHDVALLKLAKVNGRCARYTDAVQPACLPDESFPIKQKGELCQVSGWGVTNESLGQSSAAANLMWVTLPTKSNKYCKSRYNKRTELFIDDIMICAGLKTGGSDACTGDSGGPYVCRNSEGKYAVVGVVSFGIGCARAKYPGVYTNVAHFIPWINSNINANGGKSIVT